MAAVPIPTDAFARAELASERRRAIGFLWTLAALAGVLIVRTVLQGSFGDTSALAALGVTGAGAGYEALMLRLINRRLADGRPIAAGIWRLNIVIEALIPTLAILAVAESGLFRPRQALVAPVGLTYLLLIALSTLRLSPGLSSLTGAVSAAGYLGAALVIESRHAPSAPGLDFPMTVTVTYATVLLVAGFVAAGVAREIRTHVAAGLREVETRALKEKLERDLELARAIQRGLLPAGPPAIKGLEIAGWNQPADQTGGDYYDWRVLDDGRVVVTLADVTGHGVGPALIAAACRAYGRAAAPIAGDLGTTMARMNDALAADLPSGKLVTLVTAAIDPARHDVELLSAGHGPLLFYTAATGRMQAFEAHGVPFGVMAGLPYGPSQVLSMQPGDVLVLMTDGFFEWSNAADEEFGLDRLQETIRNSAALSPEAIIARMVAGVTAFAGGAAQADDLTAVVVKRTA